MEHFIIKRKGHREGFDKRKIYGSCYSAALNCHYSEKKAEKLASSVEKKVTKIAKKEMRKKRISSRDIRNYIINTIPDPEVVFMYVHHLDLC